MDSPEFNNSLWQQRPLPSTEIILAYYSSWVLHKRIYVCLLACMPACLTFWQSIITLLALPICTAISTLHSASLSYLRRASYDPHLFPRLHLLTGDHSSSQLIKVDINIHHTSHTALYKANWIGFFAIFFAFFFTFFFAFFFTFFYSQAGMRCCCSF